MTSYTLYTLYALSFAIFALSAIFLRIAEKRNWGDEMVSGINSLFKLSFIVMLFLAEMFLLPVLLALIGSVAISLGLLLGLIFLVLLVFTLIAAPLSKQLAEIFWFVMASIYLYGASEIIVSMLIHAANQIILFAGFGLLGMGLVALVILGLMIFLKNTSEIKDLQ